MKTQEILAKIQSAAKSAIPEVRFHRMHEVGKCGHQGDVYLHHVADNHPHGKRLESYQLAPGNTKGSRHVMEGEVEVYEGVALPPTWVTPEWLTNRGVQPEAVALGPVVIVKSRAVLTHPEHAHHSLAPGKYQVTYQFDPRTAARVAD